MSAFSYTAPQYSVDDEARDKAALHDDEKKEIEDDLFGNHAVDETAEMIQIGCEQLTAALNAMQDESKQAYLEALSRCPDLVAVESDPLRFLRCERYNPELAANRLVKYWEMRKVVFEDLAFRPMTLRGALVNDHELMRTLPYLTCLLPDDAHGRAVIYVQRDGSEIKVYGRLALVRVLWYMTHVALKRKCIQLKGFTFIGNLSRFYSNGQFDRIQSKLFFQSMSQCLPIKVRAGHPCHAAALGQIIVRVTMFFMNADARSRTRYHNGTKEKVFRELCEYGLGPNVLPTCMGGTYVIDGEAFLQRMHLEESLEQRLEQRQLP